MPDTLFEIAGRVSGYTHASTKPSDYYEVYERYLAALRDREDMRLLEVGVHSGESLKVFSEYFPSGRILGIDVIDRKIDFGAYPNVTFVQADQTDRAELDRIASEHAPGGFDIIIDDASHFGAFSLVTYRALFPHLKPGGLYVIEDWGTGYIGDWNDGGLFRPIQGEEWTVDPPGGTPKPQVPFDALDRKPTFADGLRGAGTALRRLLGRLSGTRAMVIPASTKLPRRIVSHDLGMVGFVKSLVDEVWAECRKPTMATPEGPAGDLRDMHVHRGIVVLRKR